jgi:hypothetical protein
MVLVVAAAKPQLPARLRWPLRCHRRPLRLDRTQRGELIPAGGPPAANVQRVGYWLKGAGTSEQPPQDDWARRGGRFGQTANSTRRPGFQVGDRIVYYAVGSGRVIGDGETGFYALAEVVSPPARCRHTRWPWKVDVEFITAVTRLRDAPALRAGGPRLPPAGHRGTGPRLGHRRAARTHADQLLAMAPTHSWRLRTRSSAPSISSSCPIQRSSRRSDASTFSPSG